jgi:DegV family protein with EDD domain
MSPKMRDYVIITDVCADLTPEMVEEIGVEVIPMEVTMEGRVFAHYPDGREMSLKEFYDNIRAGKMASTAQINPQTYIDFFSKFLEKGMDVLYIGLTSGMSGSYANSLMAVDELSESYPEAKVYTIDSLCACMGLALIVYHAAEQKKAGKSIDETRDYVQNIRQNIMHWVTVDDLQHMRRGGRLSTGAAFAGTLLHIKPIIHVDSEGRLVPVEKIRGRRASIETVYKHFERQVKEEENPYVFLAHSDCEQDMLILKGLINQNYPKIKVRTATMGPVIGAHTGIGTIALFFVGPNRDPK